MADELESKFDSNRFDNELERKRSSKDFDFWRMFFISPWNFYFAVYKNAPLEKRSSLNVKYIVTWVIKILMFVLIILLLQNLSY